VGPQLYLHGTAPDPRRVRPIRNDDGWRTDQPSGGMWTSTYLGPKLGSAYVRSCLMAKSAGAWLLEPAARGAGVATIDCRDDLESLATRYGWVSHPGKDRVTLDFENLARYVGALHLTERGALECCPPGATSLTSWGVESTLWFRWAFASVTYLGIDRFQQLQSDDPYDLDRGGRLVALFADQLAFPRRGGGPRWW